MTVQEATQIVYMLHANYIGQDRKATEQDLVARINLYAGVFADYDFELVRQAALHCIETCTFIPTVKELLDAITRVRYLNECKRSAELLAQRLEQKELSGGDQDFGGYLPYET